MHRLSIAVILLGLTTASAQDEHLQELLDKKLASAFLKKAAWELDYEAALAKAKESGKPIFAYFSRSYAP